MSQEYSFIKPFRAFAAFWVISAHALQWWGHNIPAHFPAPKMAVDLFMIISGYLMTANAVSRDSSEPFSQPRNWLRFWMRRFFRVAPAYYLVLALVILLSVPFLNGYQHLIQMAYGNSLVGSDYDPALVQYSPMNILMHVSFLYGMFPSYASSTYLPDWTLGLEMQFYFVFPFLFLLLRRFDFAKPAALIGFPAFILGLYVTSHIHYPEPSLLTMKLNYFIAGIVLHRFLTTKTSKLESAATAVLAIALVSVDTRYRIDLFFLIALFSLMMLLGKLELEQKTPKWLTPLIESRVVQVAADTSYSVYLFHGFFIAICGYIVAANESFVAAHSRLSMWLMYAFVLTGAYALSSLVYRFVELPGIRMGKRVIDKVLPRARVVSGTPRSHGAISSASMTGN